jgi:excisionase family DNA binding protein
MSYDVRVVKDWQKLSDVCSMMRDEGVLEMSAVAARPLLLTVPQAASLLGVSDRTVRRWIKAERIPFLRLPSGEYRIPQGALLASLRGTYDLAGELRQLEEKRGHLSDDEIAAALTEHS